MQLLDASVVLGGIELRHGASPLLSFSGLLIVRLDRRRFPGVGGYGRALGWHDAPARIATNVRVGDVGPHVQTARRTGVFRLVLLLLLAARVDRAFQIQPPSAGGEIGEGSRIGPAWNDV